MPDIIKLALIVLALVTGFFMLASRDKATAVGVGLAGALIGVVVVALGTGLTVA
jgi:hypothetical protein